MRFYDIRIRLGLSIKVTSDGIGVTESYEAICNDVELKLNNLLS